jgi:hypothetical protein
MTTKATIVVSFKAGTSSTGYHTAAELDDELNVDSAGNVKTSFYKGDDIYFLLQHDSRLRIVDIRATNGNVVYIGTVTRTRESFMVFEEVDTPQSFGYMGGNFSTDWEGNQATVARDGITNITTNAGDFPANGTISRECSFRSYRLRSAIPTLASDEEYHVTVVVYMEVIE